MRRVVLVGAWGSGKSRLARHLAECLSLPLIEHDPLYFMDDWAPRPAEEFRALVTEATAGDAWVADGNFSAARDIMWGRADTLVWLDYPLPLVFWRLAVRQARRFLTREVLWHGNRETLADVIGPHSLLWLLPRRHARWRREYPALLAAPEFAHLRVHRLRSPAVADVWLAGAVRSLARVDVSAEEVRPSHTGGR